MFKSGKQSMYRGSFSFIKRKKKRYVIKVLTYLLLGLALFLFGYLVNKGSTRNIFSVLAVLMALPGAKALVAFIVFAPYQSQEEKDYKEVYEAISKAFDAPNALEQVMVDTIVKEGVCNLYTDVIFTSPDKVMYLPYFVMKEQEIVCLVGSEDKNKEYMKRYLSDGLMARQLPFSLRVFEQKEKFLKQIQTRTIKGEESELREEAVNYLTSLFVV